MTTWLPTQHGLGSDTCFILEFKPSSYSIPPLGTLLHGKKKPTQPTLPWGEKSCHACFSKCQNSLFFNSLHCRDILLTHTHTNTWHTHSHRYIDKCLYTHTYTETHLKTHTPHLHNHRYIDRHTHTHTFSTCTHINTFEHTHIHVHCTFTHTDTDT